MNKILYHLLIQDKMQFKTFLQTMVLIGVLCSNYFIILEYYDEYVPDNFGIQKLIDPKYRCIRYFYDKVDNAYLHNKCKPYIYDYTAFLLEKSRYIYVYYAYNMCIAILFVIFHILL